MSLLTSILAFASPILHISERKREMNMKEIWKDIRGYEGRYQVSNLGNVKSLNYNNLGHERNLKLKKNPCGYFIVHLYGETKDEYKTVHRLVAECFLKNENNFPQINHKDENKLNNNFDNLEWCDNRYNTIYSIKKHPERYKGNGKYKRKCNGRLGLRKSYKQTRKVLQKDINGKIIGEYENPREVSIQKGYNQWSITQCCNGKRKTAYGCKWEFAE